MPVKLEETVRNIVRDEVRTGGVEEKLVKIESMREIMENTAKESLEERCKQVETVKKFMEEKAKEQQTESEDRARRQKNLVVFNVPESTAEEGSERKKEDWDQLEKIMNDIGVTNPPVDMRRLFSRKDRGGKDKLEGTQTQASKNNDEEKAAGAQEKGHKSCKPILLRFENQGARDEMLRKFIGAKKDAEEDEQEGEEGRLYLKIGMRRDMTQQERREDKELYQELKVRKDEAKNSKDEYARWVRRNGRVVNIGKYPRGRQEQKGAVQV